MLEKTPKYLSPSSLGTMIKQPHKFYLTKCFKKSKLKREPQSLAAAVGTAFDCLVKIQLHSQGVPYGTIIPVGTEDPEAYFEQDLFNSLDTNHEEAIEAGKLVLATYRKAGLLGKTKLNWVRVEGQDSLTLEGVPLFGKLDAVVYDKEYDMDVPYDYKVGGYTSKSGMTPKKGFYEVFDGVWKKPHKSYRADIPMEEIDKGFARQFCTYGWFLGHYGKEFPVYFGHLVFNKDNTKVRLASYRAIITVEYQERLLEEYKWAWASFKNGDFEKLLCSTDPLIAEIMSFSENWF